MRTLVVDLEASFSFVEKRAKKNANKPKIVSDIASPFNPNNRVVLAGVYERETKQYISFDFRKPGRLEKFKKLIESADVLIGHNIKYDCLWMRALGVNCMEAELKDTMLQEYLLLQGRHKEAGGLGLDVVAPRYGGTNKDDLIKEYWEAGVNTDEIPTFVLAQYLYADVMNTNLAYEGQIKDPRLVEQQTYCNFYHRVLKAVIEMEFNGAAFNEAARESVSAELEEGVLVALQKVLDLSKKYVADINTFNPDSPAQLSKIVFGLKLKPGMDDEWKAFTRYFKPWETGSQSQLEHKVTKCFDKLPGSLGIKPDVSWLTDKKFLNDGGISVGSKVIESMAGSSKLNDKQQEYMAAIMKYSKASTWRDSNLAGVLDGVRGDGMIHGQFNMHITVTRRFSSSEPNMQNWPREGTNPLKKLIMSRFEDGGVVSADYRQLEFRVAGLLSGDRQLIADVDSGMDIHSHTASMAFGEKFTSLEEGSKERKAMRQKAKTLTFAFQYGAMPKTKIEQAIYDAFYGKYTTLKQWQDKTIATVARTQRYVCPFTGVVFAFPGANHSNEFMWATTAKNYPVQFLADAVNKCALIGCYESVKGDDDVKLMLTVHDSDVIDAKGKHKVRAARILKREMEGVSTKFEEIFGRTLDIPLGVDVSMGPNWYEQKDYKEGEESDV